MKLPFGKIYIISIAREIRSSIGRFLAIFAITALSVEFLAGLMSTTPVIELSVDRYFRQTRTMDIFIKGTAGLTKQDAEALKAMPELEDLLGAYVMDTLVQMDDEEILTSRIYGLPLDRFDSMLNRMELLEGRLPSFDNECLVQAGGTSMRHLSPGTKIGIIETPEDEEEPSVFAVKNFTITGVVKSPLFLSMDREPSLAGNGQLGTVLFVYDRCFDMDVYTDFFITLNGTENLRAFTDQYHDYVRGVTEKIEVLGKNRSMIRRGELEILARERADEHLARANEELADARDLARREFAAARQELDSGWMLLAEGEQRSRDGEAELAAGRIRLAAEEKQAADEFISAETRLNDGSRELIAARDLLAQSKAQLDAVRDKVEQTRSNKRLMKSRRAQEGVAQYDEGLAQYLQGLSFVEDNEREIAEGRRQLADGRILAEAEFKKAREEITEAENELAAGQLEAEQARRDLEAGELEFVRQQEEVLEQLRQGEQELEEGRRKANDIEIPAPQWYVLDRNANVGYVSLKMNASKIADLSVIFPLFLMLVASLVSLTTMTRMVEEDRLKIGTLKALGYRKRVIAVEYLVYSALSGVLGSLAGMAVGFHVLPLVIYRAFSTLFHLPKAITEFNWPMGLFVSSLILVSTLGATVAACYQSMQESPSTLLRPRSPKPGKRILLEYIPFIWRSLKFTYKVSVRNLFRYKKHFFMTITGVAGCTALILVSFGLRDSMKDIAQTQYQQILRYDLRIELQNKKKWDNVLNSFLQNYSDGFWIETHTEPGYLIYGNERIPLSIITPKHGGNLGDFIALQNRGKQTLLDFGNNSVLLTEKLGEIAGFREGDRIVLETAHGLRGELTLTGLTENYVGAYSYMGPDIFSTVFGKPPEYQTLLIRTGVKDKAAQDEILTEILQSDTVLSAEFTASIQRSFINLLQSISIVVLLMIASAGGMAMIVLYNLTNININERARELATLRVLGFHRSETVFYIFREITILSILGTAAGLCLGVPLHRFVIGVAENPDLMFGRSISTISFLISAATTIGFSILVYFFMSKKISGIKMADSMKAAE